MIGILTYVLAIFVLLFKYHTLLETNFYEHQVYLINDIICYSLYYGHYSVEIKVSSSHVPLPGADASISTNTYKTYNMGSWQQKSTIVLIHVSINSFNLSVLERRVDGE